MHCSNNIGSAIKICNQGSKNKSIFAEEVSEDGERQYWAMVKRNFMDFYLTLRKGHSFYEVIQGDRYIKPFWDVDMILNQQDEIDRPAMEEEIILKIIMRLVHAFYEINQCICRDDFAVLSSYNDKKISAHLILNNGFMVEDCGIIENLTKKWFYDDNEPLDEFSTMINGKKKGIVDLAVYGKNQNFRLIHSKKMRKGSNILEISKSDRSLTNIKDEKIILDRTMIQGDKIPTLRLNENSKDKKEIHLKPSLKLEMDGTENMGLKKFIYEEFGVKIAGSKIMNTSTIILTTRENQLCENAGRKHSSNNAYFIYNTKTMMIYKKCHSQGCKDTILKATRYRNDIE